MPAGLITETGAAQHRPRSGRRLDYSIGLLLFVGAATWGTVHWNRSVTGGLPPFYQSYFEPAVMIACGKGFVIAQPKVPAMTDFLLQRTDRFSCDAIPADAALGTRGLYQGAWRYLLVTVGLAWRILGISWSGMGPFFGTLFAVAIVAAYAVFRLGMDPPLATICALAIGVSRLHLTYLPSLRDYSKAPFTLILIALLGLLVKRQPTWRGVLAVGAAYGMVLGIGYGFRTDFLANIPPFFVTLMAFLKGGVIKNLRLKAAAGLLFVATFLATGWPIVSAVHRLGGCQWHAALLGFSTNFSDSLGVDDPPYALSGRYLDEFVYVTATSYAARLRPGVGHIEYCWPEYDAATGQYLKDLVRRFPADMIVRGYASILQIAELPITWRRPIPEGTETLQAGDRTPHHERGVGLALIVAAIGLTTVVSVRVALFLLFFLLYFGGYPALQFNARHYFHLEFITWWAAGLVLQSGIRHVWRCARERNWNPVTRSSIMRAALFLAASASALVLTLWVARVYQQVAARSLLRSYLAAPKEQIPIDATLPGMPQPIARTSPGTDPETADFLEVDLNEWRCGGRPEVTFLYDSARLEFSRTFVVPPQADILAPNHIFMPVYDGFQAIELSDTRPGCLAGVYRVRNAGQFSILLEAALPPRWESMPLYQRFLTGQSR